MQRSCGAAFSNYRMERRAVMAVVAVLLAVGWLSTRAEAMACTNSTASSGRLQVRCAQWQTVEGVSDLCRRAGNASVTLILNKLRHFAGDSANISALATEVLPRDVSCVHHMRIASSSFRQLKVDFSFPTMKKLMVRFTNMSSFPQIHRYQPNLTHLILSHNRIESIDISDLARQTTPALQVLDLSYNRLTNLPRNAFSHLQNLLLLNLGHNLVEALQPGFANQLFSLQELILSGNRIRQLPKNSLRVSDSVRTDINLAGNPLETIHPQAMTIFSNMSLAIDTKSLTCDCSALLLIRISGVVRGLAPTCGSPPLLEGLTLLSVPEIQLTCPVSASFSDQETNVEAKVGSRVQLTCNFEIAGGDYQPAEVEIEWINGLVEVPGTRMPLPAQALPSPMHRRRKRYSSFFDFFDLLNPTPQTQYRYSVAVIETSGVPRNYTSTLTIHNTTFSDSGEYYCSLSLSTKFFRSSSIMLGILDPPRVTSVYGPKSTVQGQNVTILCTVSGTPKPAVIWWFQGDGKYSSMLSRKDPKFRNIQDDGKSSGSSYVYSLTLLEVKAEQSGSYICSAFSSGGSFRGFTQISVKEPPAVTIVSSAVEVHVGAALVVQCTATGSPPFNFSWLQFAGKHIGFVPIKPREANSQPQMMSHGNVSTLFYMRMLEERRHRFACRASNGFGSQNKTVAIRVRKSDVKHAATVAPPTSVDVTAPSTSPGTLRTAPKATVGASGSHSDSESDFFRIPFFITIGVALAIVFLMMVAVLVHSRRKRPQTKS